MSRSLASFLALVVLVGLTGATWLLAEGTAGPWPLAAVAVFKVAVIGAVFLELDRAWPGWVVLAGVLVVAVAGGVALLM